MERRNGWVFVSHSHKDIEIVRSIRNKFEELGFEPVLFFLKGQTDDDEIEGLICQEIDARDWFIYVDSPNARESRWVRSEVIHASCSQDKKAFTIDAQGDIDSQVSSIAEQLSVFISYSHRDVEAALAIRNALVEHDYCVWDDEQRLGAGSNWQYSIAGSIDSAAQAGCVLVLLSESFLQSDFVRREILYALDCGANVIPVCLGDVSPIPELAHIQHMKMDASPTRGQIDDLVRLIESHVGHERASSLLPLPIMHSHVGGMVYTPMTKIALRLCFDAHRNQVDKSGQPYVFHPFHLAEQMDTEEEICVALLHDVLEDTEYTIDDMRSAGMNENVVSALELMTHGQDVEYMDYIAALSADPIARKVKMADLRHNSDLNRLDRVTDCDLKRVEKYAKALAFLESA